MKNPLLLNLLSILKTLLVPVILVLLVTRLMISPLYLSFEYNKPDFPADEYGFTLADRLHYGPYALDYMVNNQDIRYLRDLTFPNGRPFYNERELQHMVDVQRVAQIAFSALTLLIIFAVLIDLALHRSREGRAAFRRGLFSGGLLTLALIAGLAIFVLVNWETFFTQFHELFFANGSWVFEYSDSLIRLYPVRFWQDTALTIGALVAASALLLIGVCWVWALRARRTV